MLEILMKPLIRFESRNQAFQKIIRSERLGLFLAVFAFLSIISHNLPSQTVEGVILEKASGTPIPGAIVLLMDANGKIKAFTQSAADGSYSVKAPARGTYRISLQKSGLISIDTPFFEISADEIIKRTFQPEVAPPKLASVTVMATPIVRTSGPNSHKYDEFLRRRSLGIGTFLTREQIEARPHSQAFQIFQGIPGLKVTQHGTSWFIHSQRCPSMLGGGGSMEQNMDGDSPLFPILFIDGFRVKGLSTLQDLQPSQIEAVEVYQGAAQLPAEAKGNACAAIYVWLKQ